MIWTLVDCLYCRVESTQTNPSWREGRLRQTGLFWSRDLRTVEMRGSRFVHVLYRTMEWVLESTLVTILFLSSLI